MAKSEIDVALTVDRLNADPWILNTPSGTVDLRTGQVHEHRRDDLITSVATASYLPANECECPRWESTLQSIFQGRDELIPFFQRLIGYALAGVTTAHILPILHGTGSNGKSLILETLLSVLGADYAGTVNPELLLASTGD